MSHQITSSEQGVLRALIELARITHLALDDSEEFEGDNGRCHSVNGQDFDDVEKALDRLDELPDDRPGYTLSPSARAEWALRRLLLGGLGQLNVVPGAHVDQRVPVLAPDAQEVDAVPVDLGLHGGEHHLQPAGSALPHDGAPLAGGDATEKERQIGELQAEIAGLEAANGHLSQMIDDLRELLQDAKTAMKELRLAAVPDESQEGVPPMIPPEAFRRFVDADAMLSFCVHQLGHNGPLVQPQRYEITSIKYLAGELTLRAVDDAEVPQELESGQVVTLK